MAPQSGSTTSRSSSIRFFLAASWGCLARVAAWAPRGARRPRRDPGAHLGASGDGRGRRTLVRKPAARRRGSGGGRVGRFFRVPSATTHRPSGHPRARCAHRAPRATDQLRADRGHFPRYLPRGRPRGGGEHAALDAPSPGRPGLAQHAHPGDDRGVGGGARPPRRRSGAPSDSRRWTA